MKSLLLPIDLCQYCLKYKLIQPFKLFLAFKFNCKGKMAITEEEAIDIGYALGYNSKKGITNNIKKLSELNWIGIDKNKGLIYLRSINFIINLQDIQHKRSSLINEKDIQHLDAFCFSSLIGSLIKNQQKKSVNLTILNVRGKKRRSVLKKGCTSQLLLSYFPIAVRGLAKILNCSTSTIDALKNKAKKQKYIRVKSNIETTKYNANLMDEFIEFNPSKKTKVRIIDNKICLRQPDIFKSMMVIKRRKKSNNNRRVS